MIVILHREVLEDADANIDLVVILWAAFRRGHVLLLDPPYFEEDASHPIDGWLALLPSATTDVVRLLLEDSAIQAVTTPLRTTVHVHAPGHGVELSWPHLHLPSDRAAAFVLRPLGVLVEDRRSDRSFLLAAAPQRWRHEIERAVRDGALEFLNGGGLGNMLHQIREHRDAETAARLWALFDSDAEAPYAASRDSERLRKACEDLRSHGLGHHQLRCRSIENYLPIELLKTWSSRVGKEAPSKVDRIAALDQNARDHIRLKTELGAGLVADLLLERQFGIEESWLRRDGHYDEVCEICESILAHI